VQFRTLLITAAVTIAAIFAAACSGSDSSDSSATATESAATAAPTASASPTRVPRTPTSAPSVAATRTAPPAATATGTTTSTTSGFPIVVKFSKHPASDSDPSVVFDVPRVSPTSGVARYAIEQLLAGPTAVEQSAGLFSTWTDFTYGSTSDCGGDPFELDLTGGTITVRFCTSVTLLGAVADGQAETAMTETLLAFSTINKVVILAQSDHCLFDASGMDLCLAP